MQYKYDYPVEILRVVDGDTFKVEIDVGFHLKKRTMIRLLGVDTHEIYKGKGTEEYRKGIEEKRFAEQWIENQDFLGIRTARTGSFGRWLAFIFPLESWPNRVLEDSLNKRLAEEFEGVEFKL